MLRLDQIKLFLLGFGVIVLCYFVQQANFIRGSETAKGRIIGESAVVFKADRSLMLLPVGYDAVAYKGNFPMEHLDFLPEIPVIYKKSDPSQAKVYTFFGFWFENIAYFLVPLFLWSAFALSYLDKGEYLTLDLRRFSFGKSRQNKDFPSDWHNRTKLD